MNREKLSEALENINSIYIESAANYRKKRNGASKIMRWGALAASCTILLLTGVLMLNALLPTNDVYWSETLRENAVLEKRKLSVIQDPDYENYISMRVLDSAHIGEKLGNVEVKSFWRNYLLKEDTDFELLRAEIYTIKGISPDIAVCIRYLDEGDALTTTHYYTYVNTNYKPKNFGDFCRTFALDFSAKNSVTLSYPSKEGTVYQYCDIDGNILIQSLTSLMNAETRAVSVWTDGSFKEAEKEILNDCTAQALFYGEILPGGTFSCRIYDNGYLYIQINKTISYLFEFSENKTEDIFRLVEEYKTERSAHETVTATTQTVIE